MIHREGCPRNVRGTHVLKAIIDRTTTNPLRTAIRDTFPAMHAVAALSLFLNLLVFVPTLYMEGSFDRVLTSRNLVTWGFLTVLLVIGVATHGLLSTLRSRILVRVGVEFDHKVSAQLFTAVHRTLIGGAAANAKVSPVQAMRDLDTLRENLSGKLLAAAVDLLFVPLFVLMAGLMHPFIGLALAVVMAVVVACGFVTNMASAGATLRATAAGIHASEYAAAMLRNSDAIHAMGMTRRLQGRWKKVRDTGLSYQSAAADEGSIASIVLASMTFAGSTLVVAVAIVLVVQNMTSAGVLFGAMIISAKAIGPVSSLARSWKSFVAAEYSFERIDRIFNALPELPERMVLPDPKGRLSVTEVAAVAPGSNRMVLRDLSFEVEPGEILAVIGPSAAGKSSLAKVLVGVWPTTEGAIRIDGSELSHWDPHELGKHVGYVPQDVELFAGTVADNIAFGRPTARRAEIEEAARAIGAASFIEALPEGYDTDVARRGGRLSAGQRQLVSFARAFLADPAVLILDEATSSLDVPSERLVQRALRTLLADRTALIIAHRLSTVEFADRVLVMEDGSIVEDGRPEDLVAGTGRFAGLHRAWAESLI
jgi:ATP-binding cassette, subfamily C, bacterial